MARQPAHPSAQRAAERGTRVEQLRLVLKTVPPTVRLLWSAAPVALLAVVGVTLGQALVPAAIAWVAKLIVDGVVLAQAGDVAARDRVVSAVMLELGMVVLQTILSRGQGLLKETIATRLKRSLSVRILDKALNLELRHFED